MAKKKNIFKSKTSKATAKAPSENRDGKGRFKSKGAKTAAETRSEDCNSNGRVALQAQSEATAEQPPVPLPLFYRNPQPLHNVRHAGKGLRKPLDFSFAKAAHAVVLHSQEFRLAAASYPIVFAEDDAAMPLAILGIHDGENLFVDDDGQWAPDAYVPAYVRRYPFATGQGAAASEKIIYLDEDSDLIVDCAKDAEAEPLFVDGEPSERMVEIRDFCAAFQQQAPVTEAFVKEVKRRDLLASKEVKLDLPGRGKQNVTGLRIIEQEKFDALPDEAILEWRHRGWLPLVYWHWISMDNFFRLIQRNS